MKEKHLQIKLDIIHAVLGMAIEDAYTFVESTDGFDPEGYKEAVKQYQRACRARMYFYEIFAPEQALLMKDGCGGGCCGCCSGNCSNNDEVEE